MRAANSFTDQQPRFPYASSEAKRQLGIPDSPPIHLAISELADRLLALPYDIDRVPEEERNVALRSASWAVRESHCCDLVVLRYRDSLGEALDQAECDRVYAEGVPTDWLGAAIARLKTEGCEVSPTVTQQATRYGWLPQV